MQYEIRVAGPLPKNWVDWFDGFTCRVAPSGETVLTGDVPDQAALAGLLAVICQMNLTLVSVVSEPLGRDFVGDQGDQNAP